MITAPRGVRLHIGLYGRRNAGKSSLLNALTTQNVSVVDETPGTTTDVVYKAMELKPVGPVVFLDTAGMDDTGGLGQKRVNKSRKAIDSTDVALLVCDAPLSAFEQQLLADFKQKKTPSIVVFNKSDAWRPADGDIAAAAGAADAAVTCSAANGQGIDDLRSAIIRHAPEDCIDQPGILSDLIGPGDVVVLVVPIDLEAPKGRLILPQVQVLREVLDCDARAVMVKERELSSTLDMLTARPALVITDSQAIMKVSADVPEDIPLTGFSVLFARWKGDLEMFVRGTVALDRLKPGDRVLIAESCTHHPIGDDIGRVKIPRWLTRYVGGALSIQHAQGHDFPDDLEGYKQVIMCGSCMLNRREVISRQLHAREFGVPVANYGLTIAFSLGVFERMLSPFPEMLDLVARQAGSV